MVHSVKTEHHEGKETRLVPLYEPMREVFTAASAGGVDPEDFVIANVNYRDSDANLRTQFERIANKAGVKPWGKAFQNMRATRETELIKQDGITSACEVIGNSPEVALEHYDMIEPRHRQSSIERDNAARAARGNQGEVFRNRPESVGRERAAGLQGRM